MMYARVAGRTIGVRHSGRSSAYSGRSGLYTSQRPISLLLSSAQGKITLRNSVIPERGSLTPSFTRATAETGQKWDESGYLDFTALAGEVVFKGAMRIWNEVLGSENFSAWTTTSINFTAAVADPWGTTRATTITATAPPGNIQSHGEGGASVKCVTSIYIRRRTGTGIIELLQGSGAAWTDVTSSVTSAWFRVSTVNATNSVGRWSGVRLGTSGDAVDIVGAQCENPTGSSVTTTPGEYVSVGVASAPAYHGSMLDGIKCFPYDRSGNPIPRTGSYPLVGYVPWQAATQLIATTADIRDMTTANWTLGATMTRARTSVGSDGVANSATRLTGGAVAATNTILYTMTAAASSRTYSAKVKRITGTGPVRITQDGFATNTDISGQLVNGAWVVVQLNQSQLNAQMGFKIDTNGDAIDVDMNQFEAGAFATPCIQTGGGTRDASILTYTGAVIANYKAMACMFSRGTGITNAGEIVALSDNTANEYSGISLTSATALKFDGVHSGAAQWATTASNAYTPTTNAKASVSVATNSIKMDFNATAQTEDTTATLPVITQVHVGHLNSASVLNGPVTDLYFWNRNLSQSELKSTDL